MVGGEEIGTGELSRAVALIRGDIGALNAAIATRPDKEDLLRMEEGLRHRMTAAKELQDLKNALQDQAIKDLEDWQRWALRLGGPTLAAAVIAAAVNSVRIGGGL